jgi:uncharacterized protein YndB with AHSA1/START domain
MAEYRFLTTWCLEAPIEPVWEAIYDSETWPQWWEGVESVVELAPGDADGIGQVGRYVWKSLLPYELEFEMTTTRVERPHLLEGEASGELAGTGRWRLFEAGAATAVVYEWNVRTTRRWMNLLAPLARPIFAWNHDYVMRHGATGLAKLLDAPLIVVAGGRALPSVNDRRAAARAPRGQI